MRTRITFAWISLLLGILAIACSPAAGPGPSQGGGGGGLNFDPVINIPEDRQGDMCAANKEVWRSPGTPIRGGTYTQSASSPSIDFTTGSAVGLSVIPQIYDMLLRPRICFGEDTVVEPSLASSWDISADGLTWTMHLRDGVKWHNKAPVNGRAFTSADVAWTIDFQQKGGILKAFYQGVTHSEPDAKTIVLKLDQPRADFIQQLAFHTNIMLPREVYEEKGDFKTIAIGTGSFMLSSFRPAQEALLARNPDYYRMGADGKSLPYIDAVRSLAFADKASESAALRSGQLDYGSAADIGETRDLQKNQSSKLRAYTTRQGSVHAVWFNGQRKPWDDIRLRQAFSLAINRQDIYEGSERGGAIPSGFVPSVVPGAWQDAKLKEKFVQNTAKAKELLTQAGYQPGQLKVSVQTTGNYSQNAEVIIEQLKQIGVDAKVDVKDMGVGGGGSSLIMAKGDYDVAWAVLAPTFFPDYWGYDIVYSKSSQNVVRVYDDQLDQLALSQRKEMDPVKRNQLIDQIQNKLYDMMAYAPVQSLYYLPVDACRVKNIKPKHYTYQREGLVEAWLDPQGTC